MFKELKAPKIRFNTLISILDALKGPQTPERIRKLEVRLNQEWRRMSDDEQKAAMYLLRDEGLLDPLIVKAVELFDGKIIQWEG